MTSIVLQGVPRATLQQWLTQAQAGLQALMTGRREATVSYAEGNGMRSVTYSKANINDLRAWITELQAALSPGSRPSRRALDVVFR